MKVGDPASIERWAAKGHLPVIRSLLDRGCHARLAGPQRICEHGTGGRGRIGDMAPVDFTPTLLALLRRSQPGDMAGRPHAGLLGAGVGAG